VRGTILGEMNRNLIRRIEGKGPRPKRHLKLLITRQSPSASGYQLVMILIQGQALGVQLQDEIFFFLKKKNYEAMVLMYKNANKNQKSQVEFCLEHFFI